jgi:hypothetical protein
MEFSDLKGLTLARVSAEIGGDLVTLVTDDGRVFNLWHEQDCCETVDVNEIIGDLGDLIGSPLLVAEETSNEDRPTQGDSWTWTFYRLGTIKGTVVIRWLGESNGYYSEAVSFAEIKGEVRKDWRSMALSMGAFVPRISEQLERQGFNLPAHETVLAQRWAEAVTLLLLHKVITGTEADKARTRILQKLQKLAKEAAKND